jgi:serine O-acetyltransferase
VIKIPEDTDADPSFDLAPVVNCLAAARRDWRNEQGRSQEAVGRELPSPQAMAEIVSQLSGILFPMRLGPLDLRQQHEDYYIGHLLDLTLHALLHQAKLELKSTARGVTPARRAAIRADAHQRICDFAAELPTIRRLLDSDVRAAFAGDPAASSIDEVLLCYPGIRAILHHRIAHALFRLGLPILARMVAEAAHTATGIDIHPGAQIGGSFFIDHGTGVVIGATTVIGERVRLFQAVTLGARSFPKDAEGKIIKSQPRHPIIEDDVVIYSGAAVLGRITIGKGAVIGGNVWLTEDVPPGASVTQVRAEAVVHPPRLSARRPQNEA